MKHFFTQSINRVLKVMEIQPAMDMERLGTESWSTAWFHWSGVKSTMICVKRRVYRPKDRAIHHFEMIKISSWHLTWMWTLLTLRFTPLWGTFGCLGTTSQSWRCSPAGQCVCCGLSCFWGWKLLSPTALFFRAFGSKWHLCFLRFAENGFRLRQVFSLELCPNCLARHRRTLRGILLQPMFATLLPCPGDFSNWLFE